MLAVIDSGVGDVVNGIVDIAINISNDIIATTIYHLIQVALFMNGKFIFLQMSPLTAGTSVKVNSDSDDGEDRNDTPNDEYNAKGTDGIWFNSSFLVTL